MQWVALASTGSHHCHWLTILPQYRHVWGRHWLPGATPHVPHWQLPEHCLAAHSPHPATSQVPTAQTPWLAHVVQAPYEPQEQLSVHARTRERLPQFPQLPF